MVYSSISICGRTDLHIIWNGNLASQRYASEILRPICPHIAVFGSRNRTACFVKSCLEVETIQRMECGQLVLKPLILFRILGSHYNKSFSKNATSNYFSGLGDCTL
ncbi:hypothetical protein TNCV_3163601 [Trichonephila clavipes]|nr:hypothetical protein TNCV_3163601 [Trichonephila clavipes]